MDVVSGVLCVRIVSLFCLVTQFRYMSGPSNDDDDDEENQ